MYKMFGGIIVSMTVVSTFAKAMDKLPSAKPSPELVKEMENIRKIAEVKKDALLWEKYMRCVELFHEESNEIRESLFQESNSINSVEKFTQIE